MVIGVPTETHRNEHRVGLNPFAVARLTQLGHTVVVEHSAGEAAHFTDRHYEQAGARIVYSADEVYGRSGVVCGVEGLTGDEIDLLQPGPVACAFQHLAVAPRAHVERLMAREATLIAYELIRDNQGDLPVLLPFSEMAGRMAVHIAAHYLQIGQGGRGILMGNIPGVPPPTVLILGAGTAGSFAARQALLAGAHVIILDADLRKLSALNREFRGQAVTVLAAMERLAQYTAIADVVIGAVLIPGERAPFIISDSMVKTMKPGSVIVDLSIDQGGCVETSRPTTLDDPTFREHDVIHYCVPNMTSSIARTASRALVNAALPFIVELVERGPDAVLREDERLAEAAVMYKGRLTNERVGRALDLPATPLDQLL